MLNPYQSPNRLNGNQGRNLRIIRGALAAFVLGVIGYLIPFLILQLFFSVLSGEAVSLDGMLTEFVNFHEQLTLGGLKHIFPNIGCLLVFSLAGFVNYASPNSPGILRTLKRIGIAAITGVIVAGIATEVFVLWTPSYTSDPHAPKRIAIFAVVPIGYAIWLLIQDVQSIAPNIDEQNADP